MRSLHKIKIFCMTFLVALAMISCGSKQEPVVIEGEVISQAAETSAEPTDVFEEEIESSSEVFEEKVEETISESDTEVEAPIQETEAVVEESREPSTEEVIQEASSEEIQESQEVQTPVREGSGYLVVIDAGHQGKGNSEKEPVGPGAAEMKAKVSSGTAGKATGIAEYVLTLQLALKLETELNLRGYEVIMVRTTHDVNISNSERAQVANDAGADAFIRIHANGSEDSSVNGAMTICQTKNNPYNAALYEQSKALSAAVLDEMVAAAAEDIAKAAEKELDKLLKDFK